MAQNIPLLILGQILCPFQLLTHPGLLGGQKRGGKKESCVGMLAIAKTPMQF